MKKLLILLMLFSFNANAANFTDTLGTQCGEILLMLDGVDYPSSYPNIKPRNSQFWALDKCLETYKKIGGDMEKLNGNFLKAKYVYDKDFSYCTTENREEVERCIGAAQSKFKSNMAEGKAEPLYTK